MGNAGFGAKGAASRRTQQYEEEIWYVHSGHTSPPSRGEGECPSGKSDDDWHHQSKGMHILEFKVHNENWLI